jgi:hypothetical protein
MKTDNETDNETINEAIIFDIRGLAHIWANGIK